MLDTELVPARAPNSRRLMVVLHGLGDSLDGYRWLPPQLGLPWLNFLLVNAPDPYYGGFSWYDIYGAPEPGVRRSRQMLFELLDTQRAAGFPSEQTVVFGFSQGSLLTVEAGVRYPHRLAGLVGISGYVHAVDELLSCASPVAREQRFLLTHGTADPLIPIALVRAQAAQLQAAGLRIDWREFVKDHTIAGAEELEAVRRFVVEGFDGA